MKLSIILFLLSFNLLAGTNKVIENITQQDSGKEYVLNLPHDISDSNYRDCPDRIKVLIEDSKELSILLPSREFPTLRIAANFKKKNSTLIGKCFSRRNQYNWSGKTCETHKQRTNSKSGTFSVEYKKQDRGYFLIQKTWDYRSELKKATLSLDGKIIIESYSDKFTFGEDAKPTTCIFNKIQ